MSHSLDKSIQILERTPQVLHALLYNADKDWTQNNEGDGTWSAYDVIGHLIHCDEENWIPRILVTLSDTGTKTFVPLDRFAQFEKSKGKMIDQLLEDFITIRSASLIKLRALNIGTEQLGKTATHPNLGTVTLSQLIATWVAHDLDHLSQIARVMAKQYKPAVGPWISYLKILKQ